MTSQSCPSVSDCADNCISYPNPLQVDNDADGIGNACEPDGAPEAPGDCLVGDVGSKLKLRRKLRLQTNEVALPTKTMLMSTGQLTRNAPSHHR